MAELGAMKYIGYGLWDQIQQIVSENNLTPSNAASELTKLSKDVLDFSNKIVAIDSTFTALKIEYEELKHNEAEIGISFPLKIFNSNLDDLEKEIHKLDQHFKAFKEAAGDDTSSLKIKTISSSDIQFYIYCSLSLAFFLSKIIDWLVGLYSKILEIKIKRQELEKLKLPKETIESIQKYEKTFLETEVETAAERIIKESYKGNNERKKELQNHVKISLKYLAEKIDQGVTFEVQVGMPEEPELVDDTDSNKEKHTKALKSYHEEVNKIEDINRKGRAILLLSSKQIPLPLLSSESDGKKEDNENKPTE